MIKKILLKSVGCFDDSTGADFEPTLVNFIYGSNGSGKTTISNVIDDESIFPSCSIDRGLQAPIKSLVYNQNFIEKNFEQTNELKGIFTLGEGNQNEVNAIITKKADLDTILKNILGLNTTIKSKSEELLLLENGFEQNCWDVYTKYKDIFSNAFTGFKNSKSNYKAKILQEFQTNTSTLSTYEQLEKRANDVLNQEVERLPIIPPFLPAEIDQLEKDSIFSTRIIGKDDVDIVTIILKLNNSDWVRQGIKFYEVNDDICPFCQQDTDEHFKRQLEEYFDETYLTQINTLKLSSEKYILEVQSLIKILDNYKIENHKYIDYEIFDITKQLIESTLEKNILSIKNKEKEPTTSITLDSITLHIKKISEIITESIKATTVHNTLSTNIASERDILKKEIWKFIIEEIRPVFAIYYTSKTGITSAIIACEKRVTENNVLKTQALSEIEILEKSITNIIDTINTINKTLKSFGFANFELKESQTETGHYEILRPNGVKALKTLSEGEKTFLTFLYFYHLINGSIDQGNITEDKIIVIDDPISSLDSSVLFIVSNLCRKIIADCQNHIGNIKQVFILTHNVYFHKEVTFISTGYKTGGISYWTVNKRADNSIIKKHDKNPVQTSYDLLWQEIRNNDEINNLTVYNTLRRILEYYFKILGKVKDDNLLNKFEGSDKIIGNSLLSWINDGSHMINDDIFVSTDSEMVEKYLEIFKRIFIEENQIEHYNMMMRIEEVITV